jgi:CheY-like chemotaxis protein
MRGQKRLGAKHFAFFPAKPHADCMTQPLALVFYEKLMPGSQLVNRLQDLNYRVQAVNDVASFQRCAQSEGPMLVFADLESREADVCQAIAALKSDPATQHIPVVAFASEQAGELQVAAQKAGAKLVVSEMALMDHLPELLNQALQVE